MKVLALRNWVLLAYFGVCYEVQFVHFFQSMKKRTRTKPEKVSGQLEGRSCSHQGLPRADITIDQCLTTKDLSPCCSQKLIGGTTVMRTDNFPTHPFY